MQASCIACYFLCLASRIVRTTSFTTTARDPPPPPPRPCSPSPPSPPPPLLLRFCCLLRKVHHMRLSCFAHAARPAPPACTCTSTSRPANHSSLALPPRPTVARHDPHARASALCSQERPFPRYAPMPCAPLATIHQASKTWLLHNITESPLAPLVAPHHSLLRRSTTRTGLALTRHVSDLSSCFPP